EYFFACLMTPISQRLEPPANPGRFTPRRECMDGCDVGQHMGALRDLAGLESELTRVWPERPPALEREEARSVQPGARGPERLARGGVLGRAAETAQPRPHPRPVG